MTKLFKYLIMKTNEVCFDYMILKSKHVKDQPEDIINITTHNWIIIGARI